MGYGLPSCYLFRIGGKSYIQRHKSASNSDVEAFLGFYVDFGLASKVEELVEEYLRGKRAGLEKPSENILTCPLWGAMQPRWGCVFPECNGKLRVEIKSRKIRYEPMENLKKAIGIKQFLFDETC